MRAAELRRKTKKKQNADKKAAEERERQRKLERIKFEAGVVQTRFAVFKDNWENVCKSAAEAGYNSTTLYTLGREDLPEEFNVVDDHGQQPSILPKLENLLGAADLIAKFLKSNTDLKVTLRWESYISSMYEFSSEVTYRYTYRLVVSW